MKTKGKIDVRIKGADFDSVNIKNMQCAKGGVTLSCVCLHVCV